MSVSSVKELVLGQPTRLAAVKANCGVHANKMFDCLCDVAGRFKAYKVL